MQDTTEVTRITSFLRMLQGQLATFAPCIHRKLVERTGQLLFQHQASTGMSSRWNNLVQETAYVFDSSGGIVCNELPLQSVACYGSATKPWSSKVSICGGYLSTRPKLEAFIQLLKPKYMLASCALAVA
jgi:hypothetical protein